MSIPYIAQTGPLLMGSLFGYFLNGVFAGQLYSYCTRFARTDTLSARILVIVVSTIELLHVAFSTHTAHTMLAVGFGNPGSLLRSPFSGAAMPALNGIVGFCTQIFFAWRILKLNNAALGKVSAGLVALAACLQCGAALGVTIQFTLLSRNIALLRTLKMTVILWLAGSFVCDVVISLTIAGLLSVERQAVSYTYSRRVVDRLIVHTVENGLVTTVCALVDLIVYLRLPDSWFYVCFEILLGRLYAVVLLASLNHRQPPSDNITFHCTLDSLTPTRTSLTRREVQPAFPIPRSLAVGGWYEVANDVSKA